MFQLYLIGGIVAIAGIAVLIIWFSAKAAGRKQEQYKNMKEDIKNGQDINKIKSGNVNKPIDAIRERLRKRIQN